MATRIGTPPPASYTASMLLTVVHKKRNEIMKDRAGRVSNAHPRSVAEALAQYDRIKGGSTRNSSRDVDGRKSAGRHTCTPCFTGKMSKHKLTKLPECECGCGATTKGGRFLPGHDAKLKKSLIEAALLGSKRAETKLEKLGWTKFLDAKHQKLAAARKANKKAEPTGDRRRSPRRQGSKPAEAEADGVGA